MGGGGHKAAAGFTSETGIDDTLAKVLPQLQAVLAEADREQALAEATMAVPAVSRGVGVSR